jgi:hypothetical protein
MAQVKAVQRQRIAYLMELELSRNGLLDKADRDELTALQKLAGIAPDAPISLVNKWAAGLWGQPSRTALCASASGNWN